MPKMHFLDETEENISNCIKQVELCILQVENIATKNHLELVAAKLKVQLAMTQNRNKKRKENAEKRKNKISSIPKKEEKPKINTLDKSLLQEYCAGIVKAVSQFMKTIDKFFSHDQVDKKFQEFIESFGIKFNKIFNRISYCAEGVLGFGLLSR